MKTNVYILCTIFNYIHRRGIKSSKLCGLEQLCLQQYQYIHICMTKKKNIYWHTILKYFSLLQLIYVLIEIQVPLKESRIRETPTLSACADSSTNTMKSCLFFFTLICTFGHFIAICLHFLALFMTFLALFVNKNHVSQVTCLNMSHVTCHMSHVTYHMSPSTCH